MQPKMGKWVADTHQINKSDNKTVHIKIIKKENNNNSSSSSPIYPFIYIFLYMAGVSEWVRALPIAYPFYPEINFIIFVKKVYTILKRCILGWT